MTQQPPAPTLEESRRRGVRLTAWITGLIAGGIFVAFLLSAVLP